MSGWALRGRNTGAAIAAILLMVVLGVLRWWSMASSPPAVPQAAHQRAVARPDAGASVLLSSLPVPMVRGVTAAILAEPENARINRPGVYEGIIRDWRATLLSLGVGLVAPGDADVLIVPQALCLGPVQRRLIQTHLARGRGVITTGAVGAFDGVCAPLRDTLVASLLGIGLGAIRPAPQRGDDDAHYAVLLGESVLGAHMPPGSRVELRPAGQIVFLSDAREMLYSDVRRAPLDAGRPFFDAAALRAAVGPGRVVALGFSPTDLVGQWSVDIGHVVTANAVQWAAGHTVFQLAPWPEGTKSAAVLTVDIDTNFQDALHTLDALAPLRLPGTAFIAAGVMDADSMIARHVRNAFEIGALTTRHHPPDTLTDARLVTEIADSQRRAERLAGHSVAGLRASGGRATLSILQGWADVGGRYVLAGTDNRSAAPEILPLLPDSLILLAHIASDDGDLLDPSNHLDPAAMSRVVAWQVGASMAYRGLYVFSLRSRRVSEPELAPVLLELAQTLRRTPDVWTATAGQVAEWWRGRAAVHLVTASDGRSATLTNTGSHDFRGGRVVIDAANGARRFTVLPTLAPGAMVTISAAGTVTRDATLPTPGVGQRPPAAR
jgi:peptidoglycan/xylan/chitin deacetylase (PgdA/CDA1 family)